MFRTLQDRLPKELALAGLATVEAANAWLRDTYVSVHNARFAVKVEQEGTAFVPVSGLDLTETLCVQEERVVGNDNCVSFLNRKLQIPRSPIRAHFVKASVKVHQYPDGRLAIFHGRRCLGRYDAAGVPIGEPAAAGGGNNADGPSRRKPRTVLAPVNRDRGRLATPPLPHHRAYGSVPRRFGGLSARQCIHGEQPKTFEASVGEGAMQRARGTPVFTITGIGVHDPPESAFTIDRN